MELRIYLRELNEENWIDISARTAKPTLTLKEGFSIDGKTGDITSLTLTIRALSITDAAAFHTTEKLIRVNLGSITVFEGYSDGKATVDMASSTGWVHVKVTFNAYSRLLEDSVAPAGGLILEGKSILAPSDTSNSLVHLMVEAMYAALPDPYKGLMAITDKTVVPAGVSRMKTLPVVYVPEGEVIFDAFASLLYENGLSFYFRDRQVHILSPWNPEAAAREVLLTSFLAKPIIKQQPIKPRTHLVLSLAEITAEEDAVVYDSGDPDSDDSSAEIIEAWKTYPEDGEPEELSYEKADDEDAEIVCAIDPELEVTAVKIDDSGTSTEPATLDVDADIRPDEGTVLFENSQIYDIGLQRWRVTAEKAYWKKYTTKVKDSAKEGEEEEYEADYIPDTESAEDFVERYHMQEYASNAELQLSSAKVEISVGEIVAISELPYKLLCISRQTSYETDSPVWKYSFVPLVVMEVETGITHPGTRPGNGFRYLFLELSQTYFHFDGDGNPAPTDQTITVRLQRVNIASSPVWRINGIVQDTTADTITIPVSVMEGLNLISIDVAAGGIQKGVTITRIQDGSSGNPQYFFQWAASPDMAPDDSHDVLSWGSILITWDDICFVTNSGSWTPEVPEKPEGLNYLWQKFWNYSTKKWEFICLTGTPAQDFSLVVNPQTFRLTSRGVVKEDPAASDSKQKISVTCRRINTTGAITWNVQSGLDYVEVEGGTEIVILLPVGEPLTAFTVACSIAEIGLTKSYVISGVQEGVKEPMYLDTIYPSLEALEAVTGTTEGPLIYGDHALVEDSNGIRKPYYYTGTQWVFADGNTPTTLMWRILQDTLYDATVAPGTTDTMSVVDIFAKNMAVFNALVYNLKARHLHVGDGDGTAGSGFMFEVYDCLNGEKVTPVFRVLFNDKVIFQIVPSTGRIFFGTPNSSLDEPETGFMFDPNADNGGEISTKNRKFVINTDGELTVSNATMIDGTISGLFKSQALQTEASSIPPVSFTLVRSPEQARQLYQSVASNSFFEDRIMSAWDSVYVHAESPQIANLGYIAFNKRHTAGTGGYYVWSASLLDKGFNRMQINLPFVSYNMYSGEQEYPSMSEDRNLYSQTIGDGSESSSLHQAGYIDANVTITVSQGDVLLLDVPLETVSGMRYGQVYSDNDGILRIYRG